MATHINEETPLIITKPKRKTPLPKRQLGIVLLLQLCEPITSQSIYPYINQLVSELDITGGDERKVGYYAGLIESLFFATEAVTVLQWSRISDHIGRKPVLLLGLFGTTLSMLAFGLSRTFWGLVASRCVTGLLNGNIGVMKSVMGELTDSTNRAEGFALVPVIWAAGVTFGPFLGGTLSRPHERFPTLFSSPFWERYPYFLPCLATSSFVLFAFVVALFLFKETLPKRKTNHVRVRVPSSASDDTLVGGNLERTFDDAPLPLRQIIVWPVIISVSNYVSLAFLNICMNALLPLFFAMPIEIGGLGLSPPTIGFLMGLYGAGCGVFQGLFFSRIVERFGEKRVFMFGVSLFIPMFAMFPVISCVARWYGLCTSVWVLVSVFLSLLAVMDLSYGCIFMYITTSAPNKRSLGATNGLSQTTVSIARAIGPAMSTSLFSISVEKNILGGYGVYALLSFLSVLALILGSKLPEALWEEKEEPKFQDDE